MPLQDRRGAAPDRARCARRQRFSTGHGPGLPSGVPGPHHCATADEEEYSSVSESQRLALHRAAQAALGEEEGHTLMALTPPSNTDIATRQDVENWQALMSAQLGEIPRRLDVVQWCFIAAFITAAARAACRGNDEPARAWRM